MAWCPFCFADRLELYEKTLHRTVLGKLQNLNGNKIYTTKEELLEGVSRCAHEVRYITNIMEAPFHKEWFIGFIAKYKLLEFVLLTPFEHGASQQVAEKYKHVELVSAAIFFLKSSNLFK